MHLVKICYCNTRYHPTLQTRCKASEMSLQARDQTLESTRSTSCKFGTKTTVQLYRYGTAVPVPVQCTIEYYMYM